MTTQGVEMTYKLEPGLARISSPIKLHLPGGEIKEYRDGMEIVEAVFDKRWKVTEMRASDGMIEAFVEEMKVPEVNPIGEETFF